MWINTTNNQVKTSHSEIRAAHPNVSFPAEMTEQMLIDFGYQPVTQVAPSYDPVTQSAVQGVPALTHEGEWVQTWAVVELFATQEERDAAIAADTIEQRAELCTEIKTIRDTKIQTGGYQAAGKWFHSDTFSRTQQMALVMMGASVPPIQWKTMDGSFVTMTQALAGAIFQAAAANDVATFGHAETLLAQVNTATNPSSVDINAGWPATFA